MIHFKHVSLFIISAGSPHHIGSLPSTFIMYCIALASTEAMPHPLGYELHILCVSMATVS